MTSPSQPTIDSSEYQRLRDELIRLRAEPAPDMEAVERVLSALGKEQLRLKALDGQHGNNPIPDCW